MLIAFSLVFFLVQKKDTTIYIIGIKQELPEALTPATFHHLPAALANQGGPS